VARHRQAVRLDDVVNDPRHFIEFGRQTGLVPRTMICVPMISKDTLRGVIQMINKVDGSSFTEAELEHAQTLADHAAMAIENASLYHQAYLASITDDLTGLGNTRHFNRSLTELIGRGGLVSLVIFDLDNFKAVVDGYGHLVGSRTIAQIGRTVARLIRPGDVAARFGGDEFVIVLPDTDAAAALRIAEAIRAAVASTAELEGEAVDLSGVTASVGVASFPEHAADAESLFRAADTAMYSVKRSGKNRVALAGASPLDS
jgi:diguanylate cyclase (GGDEF)-like protein